MTVHTLYDFRITGITGTGKLCILTLSNFKKYVRGFHTTFVKGLSLLLIQSPAYFANGHCKTLLTHSFRCNSQVWCRSAPGPVFTDRWSAPAAA